MNAPLTEEKRQALLAKLSEEPSDTKLATEFGVSRKTVWRLRQTPVEAPIVESKRHATFPPAPPEPLVVSIPTPPPPKLEVEPEPEPVPEPTPEPVPERPKPAAKIKRTEDVLPKVDVEPVVLGTYLAIQMLRGENYKFVVERVLAEADILNILFRKIQVLEIITVGTGTFVRLRMDLPSPHLLLAAMLKSGRATIDMANGTGFISFPGGRHGKYPTSSLCAMPKIGFGQIYAGTRIKRWKAQFAA